MTTTTHSLRLAGSAIAAALALASTPSLAQDAAAAFPVAPDPVPAPSPEPVIVIPDIPAASVPEPTVVLPAEVPEATVETPAPEASPAATATHSRTTAPAASQVPAPRVRAPEAAPVEPIAAISPVAASEPIAIEPVPTVATSEPATKPANADTGILLLILGAMAVLALAIWAFVAIGRRKPVRRYAVERPTPKRVPLAQQPAVPSPVALAPVAIAPERPLVASFAPRQAPVSGALPHTGASVALPARVPEDFAERDALMKRMVAARPDRANPFTDRGARTRRARLILQSLGRDFGEAEPWIDLSQYPRNWPDLARKRSAAA